MTTSHDAGRAYEIVSAIPVGEFPGKTYAEKQENARVALSALTRPPAQAGAASGEDDGGEAIIEAARRMVAAQGMDWATLDTSEIGYWESLAAEALNAPSLSTPAASGEIPGGMVECDGNGRPADYDGGEVLLRDGSRFTPRSHVVPSWRWRRRNARPESDIIAYTPITTPKASAETARHADDSEWKRDCWNDFFSTHLTDGNDGYRAANVIAACRAAFDAAWPDFEKAEAAAIAALSAAPSAPATEVGDGHRDRFANEDAAKALYDSWSDKPGWVPWVERGNSDMQSLARREAAKAWRWWAGREKGEYRLSGPCMSRLTAIDAAYGDTLPGDTIYLVEAIAEDEPNEDGVYAFIAERNHEAVTRSADVIDPKSVAYESGCFKHHADRRNSDIAESVARLRVIAMGVAPGTLISASDSDALTKVLNYVETIPASAHPGEMTLSQVMAEAKRVALLLAKCNEVNSTEMQHWRETIAWMAALSTPKNFSEDRFPLNFRHGSRVRFATPTDQAKDDGKGGGA